MSPDITDKMNFYARQAARMEANLGRLWASTPVVAHRKGVGKTHALDRDNRTRCGVRGDFALFFYGKPSCKRCAAIVLSAELA